jgi:hypothetical protein
MIFFKSIGTDIYNKTKEKAIAALKLKLDIIYLRENSKTKGALSWKLQRNQRLGLF